MTIKDVEKLTGLTAKSIRYYEAKGLLTVERNEENDYRSYSEAEVNRLKKIKVLRYVDFSVEEIKSMLDMETEDIVKKLQEKADTYLEEKDKCEQMRNICLQIAKDLKKNEVNQDKLMDEYNEAVDFMESGEMAELEEQLRVVGSPSLSLTIVQSLIYSGPIMWLFLNISDGKLDGLMLNAALALLGTVLLTGIWIYYIIQRLKYKKHVKKRNHQTVWIIPAMILCLVLGLVIFTQVMGWIEKILAPENFLFYELHPIAETTLIVLMVLGLVLFIVVLLSKFSKLSKKDLEQSNDIFYLWNLLGKFKPLVFIAWLVALYCSVTSVTFFTEDEMVYYSPIHPMGITYSYSDVEKITTGFGNSNFTLAGHKKKGHFYYQLEVDGKTISLSQPYTNGAIERYTEDTYLELEEFDQRMMALGIPKEGDITGYQNVRMDQVYVDRFIRIIENK